MLKKVELHQYVWFCIVIGAAVSVVYFYQYSTEPALETEIVSTPISEKVRKSKFEILAEIKIQFPISYYKTQLEEKEQQLQTKFENADLVERIVLERELTLQKIKIDNIKNHYDKKIHWLVEHYQSLDKFKDQLKKGAVESAQVELLRGNTNWAYELFSQIEFKQRKTNDLKTIQRAAEAAYQRGKISEDQIDYRKAFWHYRQAVNYTPNNTTYLLAAGNIANKIALYNNAIDFYESALQLQEREGGTALHEYRQIWISLGNAWNSKGQPDEAIRYFSKALASDLENFGSFHPNIAIDKNGLGWAWETKGQLKKAIEYYKQALKVNESALGLTHPETLLVKDNLQAVSRLLTQN